MKHTYTSLDFLRYYYKEMPPEEMALFEEALSSDPVFQKEYQVLCNDVSLLNKAEIAPSNELINDLLDRLHRNENKEAAY